MFDFILNECAGGGKAKKVMAKVEKALRAQNVPYRIHKTKHKRHATQIAKDLSKREAVNVVVVGGDGTIHEVVNGLNFNNATLGIIPAGSGNDFVTNCHIPMNTKKAINVLLECSPKSTDILDCDGVFGINAVSTGIDVDIVKRCNSHSILWGKAKYLISLLVTLTHFRYRKIAIERKNIADKVLIVTAANGAKFGGGINICPSAVTNDGKLDLMYISKVPILKAPLVFFRLMSGKILSDKVTHSFREDSVFVQTEKNSVLNIDGELYENLSFNVAIVKEKLKLFRP